MAYPSVTYTFTNGTTADGANVSTNFTNLVSGFSDGTKDFNMNAGTLAGNFTCNGNVVLGNATSDTIALTGIVSIGTSGSYLANLGGTVLLPTYTFTGDLNTGIWSSGADAIDISTAGVQRVRVDSNGVFTIGSSASPPAASIRLGQTFAIHTSATYGGVSLNTWSTTAAEGSIIDFNRSKSATIGTHTVVASGDNLGNICFQGSDGTGFITAAQITGAVDGTPGTNDMPGRLLFSTTADGASSVTERMRISSAGVINMGSGSTSYSGAKVNIMGANVVITNAGGILSVGTSDAAAADVGGSIGFYANTFSTANYAMGNISARYKTNSAGVYSSYMAFATTASNGTIAEKMRLDDVGSLLIGTSPSTQTLIGGILTPLLQVQATSVTQGISTTRYTADASGSGLFICKSRGTAIGTNTVLQSNDSIGTLFWEGADGTNLVTASFIQSAVEGTPTAGFCPSRLVFATSSAGASATERMRIDSTGYVGIGITPTNLLHVSGSVASTDLVTFQKSTATTNFTTDYANLSLYNNNNTTNSFNSIWFYGNNSSSAKQGYAAIGSIFTTPTASSEAGALTFYTRTGGGAVTERLRIEGSGRIYASSAIQRALGSTPDSTSTTTCYIEAGTFTSTITNGTNVSSTGTLTMHWQRIGNIVTCGFQCSSIIASSGTSVLTNFKFTLPISATYSAATNLNGTGVVDPGTTGTRAPAMVYGVSSSGLQAQFEYLAVNTTNSGLYGTFTYLVQ